MTTTPPDVKSIFGRALEIESPAARAAYLEEACGTNAGLRAELEGLLRYHCKAAEFMGRPLAADATDHYETITERPGTVIGPYKLMEQIGEGGMGLVFVADQQHPVRRKVALKIIKPGMDTRDVMARFEAERQALALMDHPNIARVFDAGSTPHSEGGARGGGRPYFVMELVKGIPIIDYCDQQQLTTRERLELLLSVCQAVQHAHGKGIIHRDLKPSNILVAPHDGVPVVKVIDFGVAKAIGQQLTDKTIYTRFTQMIGTPLYMSPEQAELNALDVDIRSDVYSLGVLLYELLTGTTPFDRKRFATAAYDEIRRIIKEEEPPKPSTRLSTMGESLSKVSSQRKTEPAKLSALVKGDLDWIVMKALEKDRLRRYETASSFAADVRRFLADEPIEARPPSTWYRFRRMARRNKMALTTAAIVAAALVVGTGLSTWQAVRATRAEKTARLSADRAAEAEAAARLSEQDAREQRREADGAKDRAEKRRDELAALNEKLRRLNYLTDMNLARHAWDENNLALAGELLERQQPKPGETDLRGFEWHYLRRLQHRDLRTVNAHAGMAKTVAWTPDGKRLVSVGTTVRETPYAAPGEIKLWDAATLTPLPLRLEGAIGNVIAGALSSDGKLLAAGCHDKRIRLWHIETGKLIATLEGHTVELFQQVVFSPDGKHLASRAMPLDAIILDNLAEVRIWDLDTRKAIAPIDKLPLFGSVVFSSDGKRVAFNAARSVLKVLDALSGRELLVKDITNAIMALALSPDDKRLAVAGQTSDVQILDAGTGELVTICPADAARRVQLKFSPDGKRLAAFGHESGLELWDTDTGQRFRTFKGHDDYVMDFAFSPDSARIASAGWDGRVKVWDVISDRDVIPIPALVKSAMNPLSTDGRIALTGMNESTIHLWNAETGEPLGEPIKLEHKAVNFDFTADGKRLALTDEDKNVTIWNVSTSKMVRGFKHDGPAGRLGTALSPDGKWFACKGPGGGLKVWDVDKGADLRTFPVLHDASSFLFSPDNARLAAAETSGAVKTWDLATGRELCRAELPREHVGRLSFSHDGKRLAAQCFGLGVRILDAESGHEASPPLRGGIFGRIEFSPDGTRLAAGFPGGTVKVWDVTTGQETLTLKGHTSMVTGIAFSPDGHRLISASTDMTVRIWDATPLPK
jgi:WD40 repeat protein/serine/threonine protein kinase